LTFQESKDFSFILEEFDRKQAYNIWSELRQSKEKRHVRVEVNHSKRESTISSGKVVSLVVMCDKQLSKMEELLFMGLVVLQLVILELFSIKKCFQVGKWVANHLLSSTTLKLPTSRETSYIECT